MTSVSDLVFGSLGLTGYLACARCSASGMLVSTEPVSINGSCEHPLRAPSTQRCQNCSGAGKVCPARLNRKIPVGSMTSLVSFGI